MPKPKLVCIVGDLHSGGKTALAETMTLDDGEVYHPSRSQKWLRQNWNAFIAEVKRGAKGHDLIVLLGGDLVDGVQHHGSTQTFGTDADQLNLAHSLLEPLTLLASRVYALRGTDAHSGQSGNLDRKVAEALGAETRYRWNLNIDGQRLNWAHHTSGSGRHWTDGNGLKALARDLYYDALEHKRPAPDLIVRHHVHRYNDVTDHRIGVRAVTCPCWQLPTAFVHRLTNYHWPDIGGLLWTPSKRELRAVRYELDLEPEEVVK